MTEPIERLATALADRYRFLRQLGEGGMATVHLADDLKHDREVAIKVLKPELSAIVGGGRFLSEIRTTAALQHPHILPLFDSGEAEGFLYYVMPHVQGESLRQRLDRERQLPVDEAVAITVKVAGALQAAHDNGIVHRDVKPANILLDERGEPRVADFGIALAVQEAGGGRLTETGLSLGTPFYMSPEQATGDQDPDARSDLYALACVLYEMLAGEPPHTGATAQAVIGKILSRDPTPVREARRAVPEHVELALDRALERLPADRFSSLADFAAAVQGRVPVGTSGRRARARKAPGAVRLVWPLVAVVAAVLAAWGWLRPAVEAVGPAASHLAIPLPQLGGAATALDRQLAISPDGTTLLYTAIAPDGENRTMRRRLHETESTVLPGVEPFLSAYLFSPDGEEFVGMSTDWELFRYSIDGSNERRLPEEVPGIWGAWAPDGSIWFSTDVGDQGLVRLNPSGTVERPFTDRHFDQTVQDVLPDGRTALLTRQPRGVSAGPVTVLDLQDGSSEMLMTFDVAGVRYTAGYLVYAMEDGTLNAVGYDAEARRTVGEPVRIAEGVAVEAGNAQFDVSDNGTVVYIPEEPRLLQLIDRSGSTRLATTQHRNFHGPSFSPDGRRIAVDFTSAEGRNAWVLSLEDGVPTRATFDRSGHDAQWTPDGRALTYLANPGAGGVISILRTRPGSLDSDSLIAAAGITYTGLWLSDESALVTTADGLREGSGGDIAIIRNGGRGPIEPLVATRFNELWPAVSPDDQWLAYTSDQSGAFEVYLRSLEGGGDQIQVSLDGGVEPRWGPDTGELFYRSGAGAGSELVSAIIRTEPTLEVVSREALFSVGDVSTATPHVNYDVSPDGQTFVVVRFNPSTRIMVIQNLPDLVRRSRGG